MCDRHGIERALYEVFSDANLIEIDENNKYTLSCDIDSIQFISTIVEIEEKFGIEIPDEYLVGEFFADFAHVADVVEEILRTQEKTADENTDSM